ncbi:uncharacterized protein LOC120342968 [Styela clava]
MDELVDDELHLAVRVGDLESTICALQQGLNPNNIGLFEWSSQHEAAHNGDFDILKVLLRYGGDPNCKDLLNGSTALHYAASEGHSKCLELLLSNGGDAKIKNDKGQTAPDITRHKGCKEVFAKYGIDVTTSVHFEDQTKSTEQQQFNKHQNKKHSQPSPSSFSKYTCKSTLSDDSYESGIGSKASLTDSVSVSSVNSKSVEFKGDVRSLSSGTPSLSSPCKSYSSFGSLTSIGSSIISGNDDCAGYITMAFQYNSKTSHLKVRIVEIVLTCLLPLHRGRKDVSLMLHVGGIIHNHNEIQIVDSQVQRMKTKSESFKLHPGGDQNEPIEENDGSIKTFWNNRTAHIQFKSSLGIEFLKVTKEVVKNYSIQVSVCTRQRKNLLKNSSNSIPLATVELPLKQAVKKLMKETYELQLCYVPGITRNTERIEQVLSEIVIESGKTRCPSVYSDSQVQGNFNETFEMEEIVDRSASDGDLKQVSSSVHNSRIISQSSSSYDIQEEIESDDGVCLEEVKSHSVPTSPQVKIKLPLNTNKNKIRETKMNMPEDDNEAVHRKATKGDRKKSLRRLVISQNTSISTDEEMGSQENIPLEVLSQSSMNNIGYAEQKFTSLTIEKGDKTPTRSPKVMRTRVMKHVRTHSTDSSENVNENTQYYKQNKSLRHPH